MESKGKNAERNNLKVRAGVNMHFTQFFALSQGQSFLLYLIGNRTETQTLNSTIYEHVPRKEKYLKFNLEGYIWMIALSFWAAGPRGSGEGCLI